MFISHFQDEGRLWTAYKRHDYTVRRLNSAAIYGWVGLF